MNSSAYKNLALWLVIVLVMIFLWQVFNQAKPTYNEVEYSRFRQEIDQGAIKSVELRGNKIKGTYVDGSGEFRTLAPDDPKLIENLIKNKVDVKVVKDEDNPWYLTALISWLTWMSSS